MLRRILIPLDRSSYSGSALQWACQASKLMNIELTGLAIVDRPGIDKSIGPSGIGGAIWADKIEKKKNENADEYVEELLAHFKKACDHHGVENHAIIKHGSPANEIHDYSRFFDLVVVGMRIFYNYADNREVGEPISRIMDCSHTPYLVVPANTEAKFNPPLNAVIAFDGSACTTRAIQHFALLELTIPFNITIIMSKASGELKSEHLDEARQLLELHGYQNINTIWTGETLTDEIERNHIENTDVLIFGAHPKRSFKEFILGDLARRLMSEEKKFLVIGQ